MSRQFEVYYIHDPPGLTLSAIYKVDRTLCAIEGSHVFRGKNFWFAACPSRLGIPNAQRICGTLTCDKDSFLQAAADAINSSSPGVQIAYHKIIRPNGLAKDLKGYLELHKTITHEFLRARKEEIIDLKEEIEEACRYLTYGQWEEALRKVKVLQDSLAHMWTRGECESDQNPWVLRQGINPHQTEVIALKVQIEVVLQLLQARGREKTIYTLRGRREELAYVLGRVQGEIQLLEGELGQAPQQTQDLLMVSRPRVHQFYLLCGIILFHQVESQAIEEHRRLLDEMLSWGEKDWDLELRRPNSNSSSYYTALSYHLQSIPQFRGLTLYKSELETQYKRLAAGIRSMSEGAGLQLADPKMEQFSAMQNLLILGAGTGWFTAAPVATGYLRSQININEVIGMAYQSPLYESVGFEDIESRVDCHLDSLLMFLEPRKERELLEEWELLELPDVLEETNQVSLQGQKRPSPQPDGESNQKRPKKRP
ncbi:hypothetical protein MGYG_05718 [Nannizzia gypsea CBS 118893]|uniref:Uncharacterized protein n=1 Tax=Arthroderma gypseum (strain ATCC MYA-4604 / CBS 118893) TaxID=535722 RepID=E4UXI6_ARTGP|nr:hypothetical protein MGYG_05718 [Nannizzia gypsea CBS 118893]EFR02720.1 hypothetical protein MGYG_05718 [Nannizzia gypsea CBS 118893]